MIKETAKPKNDAPEQQVAPNNDLLFCSFCRLSQDDRSVEVMIAGGDKDINICDGCLEVAREMVASHRREKLRALVAK